MRILLGCSGGLDSTFAAKLLKENHEVCGASLIMNDYTDVNAAKVSCDSMGIPFVSIDVRDRFEEYVINNFVDEYSRARTPNPCVVCNRNVKIAVLCEYAKAHGFDKVATGHYCDVGYADGRYYIIKGVDERKDQSYMLWALTQEQLAMLMTPLAKSRKDEVRDTARRDGLTVAEQKDSQDICFIPDGDYISFIEKRKGKFSEGDFIDKNGKVLGRHKGIMNYTVGQRKGLGIALGCPMFVYSIDAVNNTVTLVPSGEEYNDSITVKDIVFQAKVLPDGVYNDYTVKIRYAAKPVPCEVEIKGNVAMVKFADKQRAATPGQSAVFYKENVVVFGGIID